MEWKGMPKSKEKVAMCKYKAGSRQGKAGSKAQGRQVSRQCENGQREGMIGRDRHTRKKEVPAPLRPSSQNGVSPVSRCVPGREWQMPWRPPPPQRTVSPPVSTHNSGVFRRVRRGEVLFQVLFRVGSAEVRHAWQGHANAVSKPGHKHGL